MLLFIFVYASKDKLLEIIMLIFLEEGVLLIIHPITLPIGAFAIARCTIVSLLSVDKHKGA